MGIDRRLISHFDWGLFLSALAVPVFGLLVLYSAGYDPDLSLQLVSWLDLEVQSRVVLKQFAFLGIGLVGMFCALSFSPQAIQRYAYLIYGICIVLLVAVLAYGLVSHGSRRWFALGSFNLQPSELMKFALVLAMARFLSRHPPRSGLYSFSEIVVPSLLFGIPTGLIILQPDLGTGLAVGAIGVFMLLFMGVRFKTLSVIAVSVFAALIPAWHFLLHDYQRRRIMVLLNPEADPQGSGWHITQSKIAVGSGELLGKGFLQGTQNQLEFLPERTTDFIFCVLAEEAGFVGCVFLLALYSLFLYRLLRVSLRSKDLFGALVAFGVASMIFFHVVVNIGMVIGLLPIVGLPLPLFSYGGSALVSVYFATGVVLGISMRRLIFAS